MDRLLTQLQKLRIFVLVIQVALVLLSAWLLYTILLAVNEKYLLQTGIFGFVTVGATLLIFLVRAGTIFKMKSRKYVATQLDRDYNLKERVTTYVELQDSHHPFLEALEREAEQKIPAISPIRAARISQGTTAPLALCLLSILFIACLPYLPVPRSIAERKAEKTQIQDQARILQNVVKKIQKENPSLPEIQKALQELNNLSKDLQKGTIDKSEALKRLNTMKEQLQSLQRNLQQSRQQALAQELQKIMKGNREGNSNGKAESLELEKLAKELQESMSGQDTPEGHAVSDAIAKGNISKKQIQKMKKALEDYKRDKAESDQRIARMQDSLNNTRKGIASGKNKVTSNSKMSDRDAENSKGGVDDGPGTTNQDIGPHAFDTKKKGKGEYAEDRTKAEYENIYKGQREDAGSEPLFLSNPWDGSADPKYVPIRTFGANSDPTISGSHAGTVPQSKEEAEIRKEKIPASYQDIVKDYFESIQE